MISHVAKQFKTLRVDEMCRLCLVLVLSPVQGIHELLGSLTDRDKAPGTSFRGPVFTGPKRR